MAGRLGHRWSPSHTDRHVHSSLPYDTEHVQHHVVRPSSSREQGCALPPRDYSGKSVLSRRALS